MDTEEMSWWGWIAVAMWFFSQITIEAKFKKFSISTWGKGMNPSAVGWFVMMAMLWWSAWR